MEQANGALVTLTEELPYETEQPPEPIIPPDRTASDYSHITGTPAYHANWFVAMGSPQGIRLAFGESMDGTDATAVAHQAVFVSMDTAIKLYSTIGNLVRAAAQQQQAVMQQQLEQRLNADQTQSPR